MTVQGPVKKQQPDGMSHGGGGGFGAPPTLPEPNSPAKGALNSPPHGDLTEGWHDRDLPGRVA